jgi:hypothetical protein
MPTLIEYRSNEKPKRETYKIKQLVKQIEDLFYVDYITSFNLSKYLIKKIKLAIRKNNVTHTRFYTLVITSCATKRKFTLCYNKAQIQ